MRMPKKKTSSLESLRKAPTVFGWALELQRLLNGEREVALLRLQSVQAYINKILARSEDESLARVCFQEALRETVRAWCPNERCSKEYLACMLDLVGAYRPLEAATKIAGLLRNWCAFPKETESSGGYGSESDLNLKSLVVLGGYFEIAPHDRLVDDARIFQAYVEILFEYLETPRYGGYVASRLIEVGMIQFSDQRIGNLISSDAEAIYELLSLLFSPARRSRLMPDSRPLISQIAKCPNEAQELFARIVHANGASVIETTSGSFVMLDGQERIEVASVEAASGESAGVTSSPTHPVDSTELNAQLSRLPGLLAGC